MCYQNSCYRTTVCNSHQVSSHSSWRKLTLGAYLAPIFVCTGDHLSIDMCAIPNNTHYPIGGTSSRIPSSAFAVPTWTDHTNLKMHKLNFYCCGTGGTTCWPEDQLKVDRIHTSGWLKPELTVIKGPTDYASTIIAGHCYHEDICSTTSTSLAGMQADVLVWQSNMSNKSWYILPKAL